MTKSNPEAVSSTILYQWENQIANHLPALNSWQQVNVSMLSYGIVKAESCQQRKVALELSSYGQWESLERRFQRYLASDTVRVSKLCREWTRWIWQTMGEPAEWTLLVDETKLSNHMGVMMLGVAYENRCIPLVWHCYRPEQYPRCGQVSLILNLLLHVKQALPEWVNALVEADRGIGTSPRLCRWIDELLGWRYLFRVTCQSKIVTEEGDFSIASMVEAGEVWSGSGRIFKQRGKLPARAIAIWSDGYEEPWALVTNDETLTGYEYAERNWEEQSFRDLKSHGWQWDSSHVWQPAHARRLLLLLVLAYGWMIALGYRAFDTRQAARPTQPAGEPPQRRYSIFTEGLIWFCGMLHERRAVQVHLFFRELKPPD